MKYKIILVLINLLVTSSLFGQLNKSEADVINIRVRGSSNLEDTIFLCFKSGFTIEGKVSLGRHGLTSFGLYLGPFDKDSANKLMYVIFNSKKYWINKRMKKHNILQYNSEKDKFQTIRTKRFVHYKNQHIIQLWRRTKNNVKSLFKRNANDLYE